MIADPEAVTSTNLDIILITAKITNKPMAIDIEENSAKIISKEQFELEPAFKRNDNFICNNRVSKHTLKKSIAELAEKLGQGLCETVPYETAWVARVPLMDDISRSAFPLSLQWLRTHQLEDGSWGEAKPFSPHSKTLNTLAAIIALAQWNYPEDQDGIKHGIEALWQLADLLPSEKQEGIGFELIIPTLQNEARKYKLAIPHEHYKRYEQKGSKKLELILSEFKKYGYSKAATWWHNLEILGDDEQIIVHDHKLEFSPSMLTPNGSIGLSPSATAFILRSQRLKGIDIPQAEHYLQHVYSLYAGGIPSPYPIDMFELAFGLEFFLQASFHAKHPLLKSTISRLANLYDPEHGIGFSSKWELYDADDTSVALSTLFKAGYQLSPQPILRFFNGKCISTYVGERNPSISANINALNALKLFKGDPKVDEVIQKISVWIDGCVSEKQVFMDEKWNISPYYNTSRAVFAFHGTRNDIVKRCLDFFIKNQNSNGGWGKDGYSTAEETAYVSLALCYGFKCGYPIPESVLEAASVFQFNANKSDKSPLWIDKVLYHPTLVAESATISSQYALIQTLELMKISSTLKAIQPYYVEVNMQTINKNNYFIPLLCVTSEFDTTKYSEQIIRVREYIANKLIELNLIKTEKALLKQLVPEGSLYVLQGELSDEDLILHASVAMFQFINDDLLDDNSQVNKTNIHVIDQVHQTYLEILQGKHESMDTIILLDFPKFSSQCRFLLEIRGLLAKKQSKLEDFLSWQEKTCSYLSKEAKNIINSVRLPSHEYLELQKFTSFSYLYISLHLIIKNVNLTSFQDYAIFREFEDTAAKVHRLIMDIFSFHRDIENGSIYGNYVLVKQAECNCSLEGAVNATVKLFNEYIIKIYTLKKIMQQDPIHKSNQELFKAIVIIENLLQGTMDWSLGTKRYHSKDTISISRKQLKEANVSLISQFFKDEAKETTN